MGDSFIYLGVATEYLPSYPAYYACRTVCNDRPPTGYRIRSCCDRWGTGTYLVPVNRPPRSLGIRAQCATTARRSVRELQIKSWI